MNDYLQDLTMCAGYPKGSITIHTVRRGFANAIESKSSCYYTRNLLKLEEGDSGLTREEKNQAMGYTPGSKIFARSYMSKICMVDGQSLFRREDPQKEYIELLRTAARYRNTSLPQKMPARYAEDFECTPEMSALTAKLLKLPVGKERSNILTEQRKLRRQAQIRYQDQWAEEQYRRHISTGLPSSDSDGQEAKSVQPLNYADQDFLFLRPFLSVRSRLADLAGTSAAIGSAERQSALEDLIAIAGSDERILFRPGETPVDGRCPLSDCRVEMEEYVLPTTYCASANETKTPI